MAGAQSLALKPAFGAGEPYPTPASFLRFWAT